MLDAFLNGLVSVFSWPTFGVMLVGIALGFAVGILPGIGGSVTLALMLPFTFDMKPVEAFAFLLGMAAVTGTTGDITSVLFGVPGEATSAATVVDGHAMAKKGQAGRALGAALMSSLVGAVVGALALAVCIPIARPLVLAFGSPEFFMLTLLGITFVASLSGGVPLKALVAAGLGLLLAMVGLDPIAGVERYTFGVLELWDGVGLVPATIGLFAIPELVDLAMRGTSIAQQRVGSLGGVLQGVRDTFVHFWLVVRCSLIGTLVGIIPGLGNAVSQWMAYAHAVQSSKDRERFGQGAVEGVLGPGASNNSGIGGALVPTVAFGVPGSVTMAILLGAFLIHGLSPGPSMLTEHLPLTMSFVWVIVVSNVITVTICLLFLEQIAKITLVRGSLLVPGIILLMYVGSFAERSSMVDIVIMLGFGLLGLAMVHLDWPRPPLLLGLVLGRLAENYLFLSVARYDLAWLARPVVVLLALVSLASVVFSLLQERRMAHSPRMDAAPDAAGPPQRTRGLPDVLFTAAVLALAAAALVGAAQWEGKARLFPWAIEAIVLVLAGALLVLQVAQLRARRARLQAAAGPSSGEPFLVGRQAVSVAGWLVGFYGAVVLLGFPQGGTLGTLAFLKLGARERWPVALAITAATALFFAILVLGLHTPFPQGAVYRMLDDLRLASAGG